MAFPGLPTNVLLQQGNAQVLLSWNLVPGATSYVVQRSTDGISFSTIATVTAASYLDTAVVPGIQYYYQLASSNGTQGPFVTPSPASVVPVVAGKMTLGALRLAAQQRADRVNSQFVTTTEWNTFINQAAYELYDLLITVYEDYRVFGPISFLTNGSQYQFPLPDGILSFQNQSGQTIVAPPFYKLWGVDLGINNSPNGFVSVKKFNAIDRNQYFYPNTASTIYGVFNLRYRVIDNNINFIPTPSANQPIRLWYVPRMVQLLQDTDVIDGISGWTQYVIIRAAKYALDKEESDVSSLDSELLFLKKRIEETAQDRDVGQPDTISDTRTVTLGSGFGPFNGFKGGWMWAGLLFASTMLGAFHATFV